MDVKRSAEEESEHTLMGARQGRATRLAKIVGAITVVFLGLFAFWAVGAQADEDLAPIEHATSNTAIADSYVVFFEDGSSRSAARALNGIQAKALDEAGETYSARLVGNQVQELRRDPSVTAIIEDFRIPVPKLQTTVAESPQPITPWGLDRIDQRWGPRDGIYNPAGDGSGVDLFVMDSGISRTHPEFAGRIGGGMSFVRQDDPFLDCSGHGTAVASAAAGATVGVATDVWVYSLKVGQDCVDGWFEYSAIIGALEWLVDNHNGPTVVNMSIGRGSDTAASNLIDQRVQQLIDLGITVVVGAGNDNVDACGRTIAAGRGVITVGSTDASDSRSSFSNHGSCVDIFAPGTSIRVASTNGGYDRVRGTSISAPHVAGAAAIFLSDNPSASPAAVAQHLYSNATVSVVQNANGASNRLLYVTPSSRATDNDNPTPCIERPDEDRVGSVITSCDAEGFGGEDAGESCSRPVDDESLGSFPCDEADEELGRPQLEDPVDVTCQKRSEYDDDEFSRERCPDDSPPSDGGPTSDPPSSSNGGNDASICYGPITPGPGTEAAKVAFGFPVSTGGCGAAWNDQLGHQCQWVDQPRQGWQCFGSVKQPEKPPVDDTPKPLPPVDGPDEPSKPFNIDSDSKKNTDTEAQAAKQTVDQTTDQAATSDRTCRGQLVEGRDLDEARAAFGLPIDQGGCGVPWNDRELGHQCEWVSGSPQGWQCFGKV